VKKKGRTAADLEDLGREGAIMGWRRLVRPKWIFLGFALLVVNGGLVLFVPKMYPVQRCTGADFWRAVCWVNLGTTREEYGGQLHPRKDGFCIYGENDLHQEYLHRVPEAEALALLPQVREELDRQLAERQSPTAILRAYREWKAHMADKSDAWTFLDLIHAERVEQRRRREVPMYRFVLEEDRAFDARWEHIRRYPLNVAFEFVFLNALVVFAFWPWLRNLKAWRWVAHLASLPILLLLPCFLGYASWSFTSKGPCGGILYPWLIVWFRPFYVDTGLSRAIDRIVWIYVPKPLEWLSQPTGPWMSLSGGAGGIAAAVIFFSLLPAGVACAILQRRAIRNRRAALRAGVVGLVAGAVLTGTIFLLRLRLPVAFTLLEQGADANVCAILRVRPGLALLRGPRGVTLLHSAAYCGSEEVANLLLEKGSPVDSRDDDGLTPLHYAARWNKEKVAELLLARGADVNERSTDGLTPLHIAARSGDLLVQKVLLEHGAEVNTRTADGFTPLGLVLPQWGATYRAILLEHGAVK